MDSLSQTPPVASEAPTQLQQQVQALLCDRHAPEARALFITLAGYVDRRLQTLVRNRYADLLSGAEREEVVADVLYELLNGALSGFRGQVLPELLAYVRRISDRHCWKAARRRIREQDALDGDAGDVVRAWSVVPPAPDEAMVYVPECPLDNRDRDYLIDLLASGSRAELARVHGVSRAAVTQRVQRIKQRIAKMSALDVDATEAWMQHEARRAAGELR